MVAGQGRRLVATLVAACSDDTAASASSTTTSSSTATVIRTADGVSVSPDGRIRWEYDLVVWLEPDASEGELATLAEFEEIVADEPELREAVEAEDLPPSWRVRLVDCGNLAAADEISSWFEGTPGVRAVVTASGAVVVAC